MQLANTKIVSNKMSSYVQLLTKIIDLEHVQSIRYTVCNGQ